MTVGRHLGEIAVGTLRIKIRLRIWIQQRLVKERRRSDKRQGVNQMGVRLATLCRRKGSERKKEKTGERERGDAPS